DRAGARLPRVVDDALAATLGARAPSRAGARRLSRRRSDRLRAAARAAGPAPAAGLSHGVPAPPPPARPPLRKGHSTIARIRYSGDVIPSSGAVPTGFLALARQASHRHPGGMRTSLGILALAGALLLGVPGAGAQVAVCGNGTVEAPEVCDDGNLVDGDG